ncbi:SDR family NAD(P)-dependent oxidoreductase [Ensifer sp. 4252]|uniref:SDR family NAD(P)-dependent oxidoreductase n=1 Tax=Ensifer sp. 4252 TaxID=3373915 RepID=UPI003D23C961
MRRRRGNLRVPATVSAGLKQEETSDQDWEECIASDLSGVFYVSRAAVPYLKETKGSIVNIGSVSSLGGGWSHAADNAAKGGVANLTRSAACDLGSLASEQTPSLRG